MVITFFFFNDTATTEIYTLSLHDALPIFPTVVLEDTAALVSLGAAATGIWLSQVTGSAVWDAAASALIGLLLVGVAVVLDRKSTPLNSSHPTISFAAFCFS